MEKYLPKTQTQRTIKILGIAPYEGMKTIMQKISKDRAEIDLDVYVGDLYQGAEIAQRNYHMNYDVIISRGGTAELIGQMTHIPVIEVTLSVYDILRAIKLAENYSDRYAIVGFPSITSSAHLLCDLLQYKIDIVTIHNQDEVQQTLNELKKAGYHMVLCDMITNTTAKRLGLNAILVTSGNESISSAFDQAVKLCTSYSAIRQESVFLGNIIRGGNNQTVVIKENGDVYFSMLDETDLSQIKEVLCKEVPAVLNNTSHKFFKNINGVLYSFTSQPFSFLEEEYAAFYFTSNSVPFATSKYGIQYSNLQEAEDRFFNSFYSITSSASNMQATIENINQTSFPVMLSGESGSGKEQVTRVLYSQGSLKNNPLITINCALLNDRSWNFITNHYNSPFNDNNNTIYLKDITALPQSRRHQLLSILVDMNLCKRNRMIFSCNSHQAQGIPAEAMEFVNTLSCVTIHLSPLRERVHEIPTLCSLYLNTLNVSMANQIIGFEPDAMQLMQSYDWPYNYTQFKRILNELALVTTTPYIQKIHVATLLDKEKRQIAPSSSWLAGQKQIDNHQALSVTFDSTRTLDEINQEIIHLILAETGGNQSATAKRLGISRTTLWRYLK